MAGGVISTAQIFGLTVRESANDGSDFTNPAADYRRVFLGESGGLYLRDSAGAITSIAPGVGSAFPSSPNDNDLFFRTDLECGIYRYESTGTKWLCTSQHRVPWETRTAASATGFAASATSILNGSAVTEFGTMWIDDFIGTLLSSTTNDGTNYWTAELFKVSVANATTSLGTVSTVSNTPTNWVREKVDVDAFVDGTTHPAFRIDIVKVASPGALFPVFDILWRHGFDV